MCRVVIFRNPDCGCRWLQIYQQCRPNAGFSHCEDFGRGKVQYESPDERESFQCPIHDLRGWYDLNYVRMIVNETDRFRVGSGPSKKHPGFDVKCVVM